MDEILADRVLLRKWRQSDLEDFFEYAKNPNIGPNAGWKPHETRGDSQTILNRFLESNSEMAVVLRASGKVIGSIGISVDTKRNCKNAYQVGYCLSEDYWGQGIMSETVNVFKVYCFKELDAEVLSVYHFPFNNRSKRVIEKCGFTYEGILRYSFTLHDNTVTDEVCYSILRSEFFAQE